MDDVPEALDSFALAERLGISVRTLRSWIQARVLPRPPRQGHGTRFDRAAIVRAHAVAALRRDRVPLPLVARYLTGKSDRELRELGGLPPAPGAPRALPADSSTPREPNTAMAPTPRRDQSRSLPADATPHPSDSVVVDDPPIDAHHEPALGSAWRRIELVPGLELHVRSDAPAFVHSLAAAIASGRWTK